MIISLALAVIAIAGGTLATYLYDDDAALAFRLCAGACTGLALFGLVGFVFASLLGLTPVAIILAASIAGAPLLLLWERGYRGQVGADLAATSGVVRRAVFHPTLQSLGAFLYYAVAAAILWQVFDRAMIELPDGISTGLLNNFGDLPFHLSVITSFAHGNNFPPEDPTYAGVRFTYPFLTDFISAIFVRCGASLRDAMFIENFLVAISFVGLLHRWARVILRDRLAALLTPLLVLLNGGFGWFLLFNDVKANAGDVLGVLKQLPHSYTVIPETTWRWGNAISTLLVPQRGILLGLPLAVIVFTQWWLSGDEEGTRGNRITGTRGRGDGETRGQREKGAGRRADGGKGSNKQRGKKQRNATVRSEPALPRASVSPRPRASSSLRLTVSPLRRLVAAGIVAGLLPLVHAHSFVVVMIVGACIALLQRRWRDWAVFFIVASLIAVPQMWWSTRNSAVETAKFFAWSFGWDRGQENALWFWFKNTGLFIPLIVTAILWRGKGFAVSRRLLLFYLPFILCFVIPNSVRLAPWIWDNIKVLFYWWLASAPVVALLLTRLWRAGPLRRLLSIVLLVCLTLAGSLDVIGIVSQSGNYQVFDRDALSFVQVVKQQTEPRSLIIHAPVHNDPVFLTGRRSLMGYPGHIWTHGLEFTERESEIRRIYAGTPDAEILLEKYGVEYAVVGPLERAIMTVNDQFFRRFKKVGEAGAYSLYKIKP